MTLSFPQFSFSIPHMAFANHSLITLPWTSVLFGLEAELVGGAVDRAALRAAAGQPAGEPVVIVIAASASVISTAPKNDSVNRPRG